METVLIAFRLFVHLAPNSKFRRELISFGFLSNFSLTRTHSYSPAVLSFCCYFCLFCCAAAADTAAPVLFLLLLHENISFAFTHNSERWGFFVCIFFVSILRSSCPSPLFIALALARYRVQSFLASYICIGCDNCSR